MQPMLAGQGLKPPEMVADPSPAAPVALSAAVGANPDSYELPNQPRVVLNQDLVQCCVSCALTGFMESINQSWSALSPLFHYHVTRFERGLVNPDGSLDLLTGFSTLELAGVCTSSLHSPPFTEVGAQQNPSQAARDDGKTRLLARQGLLSRYQKVGGPSIAANIRDALKRNSPVVLGFQLPVGYKDTFPSGNMVWDDPDQPARSTSFHCVLVTGYNDALRAIHIHDSQGTGHFDQGRWWMGYRVVDSSVVVAAYSYR